MLEWDKLTVLCLGGAGQTGREICRQLIERGVGAIAVHDLTLSQSELAVEDLRAYGGGAELVASAGNLFHPAEVGTWEIVSAEGRFPRVCRETALAHDEAAERRMDLVEHLLEARLGALTPEVVRSSLIWSLVHTYRPDVVVDTINTATVLGYRGDVIQSGRRISALSGRILDALRKGTSEPLRLEDLKERIEGFERLEEVIGDLAEVFTTSLQMTAFLDSACMIRFVQCLHSLFLGDADTAIPEFRRYVKVHTTGLGGMGFNIQYTHGDTGEPGLSTKLLGKVGAAGELTQLLLTLSHTPGCDVRVVVPATLVGWVRPEDSVIAGVPLVDSEELVPCDGTLSLHEALRDSAGRVRSTGRSLEVPHLCSGENNPYAAEDIAAITALGQMGSITKEEVSRAAVDCIEGDSRYDILAAIDAAILLPTQTAANVRDRELRFCRSQRETGERFRLPSVSLGNLGPATTKLLYEIEIIRASYETVAQVAREATEMEMTLRACSHILGDAEGAPLRRQILSLGIPIFLRKGPDECGLLLGERLAFPAPSEAKAPLDPDAPEFRGWLERGWIDLTGPRMAWWKERFVEVHQALTHEDQVSRNWFSPDESFYAGQFLAYLHSISGGQRKDYM